MACENDPSYRDMKLHVQQELQWLAGFKLGGHGPETGGEQPPVHGSTVSAWLQRFLHRLQELETKLRDDQARNTRDRGTLEQLEQDLRHRREEMEKAEQKLADDRAQFDSDREQSHQWCEADAKALEADLARERELTCQLKQDKRELQTTVSELRVARRRDSGVLTLMSKVDELSLLAETYGNEAHDTLRDERDELRAQRDSMQTQRDELQTQRDDLQMQRTDLQAQCDKLKDDCDDLSVMVVGLEHAGSKSERKHGTKTAHVQNQLLLQSEQVESLRESLLAEQRAHARTAERLRKRQARASAPAPESHSAPPPPPSPQRVRWPVAHDWLRDRFETIRLDLEVDNVPVHHPDVIALRLVPAFADAETFQDLTDLRKQAAIELWYCFENVCVYGVRDPRSLIQASGTCTDHPQCLQIKRPHRTSRRDLVCRIRAAEGNGLPVI
ncbi:hypothetical protein GGR56DRAFT_677334 [Xylariaceae sp. FL0804]|nr:hypothetical protein GGR56DRAFT_677334 [Xylariaceae sp. FL0804]